MPQDREQDHDAERRIHAEVCEDRDEAAHERFRPPGVMGCGHCWDGCHYSFAEAKDPGRIRREMYAKKPQDQRQAD